MTWSMPARMLIYFKVVIARVWVWVCGCGSVWVWAKLIHRKVYMWPGQRLSVSAQTKNKNF